MIEFGVWNLDSFLSLFMLLYWLFIAMVILEVLIGLSVYKF